MTQMPEPTGAPSRPPFWNDPRIRAIVFQVLVTLGVIAIGAYLVHNLLHHRADVPDGETIAQKRKRESRESLLWLQGTEPLPN